MDYLSAEVWSNWLAFALPPLCVASPNPALSRRMFIRVLDELQLGAVQFAPVALRAGGATCLFRRVRNVGIVQFAGRWNAAASLSHCIQEALAVFVVSRFSPSARLHLRSLCVGFGFTNAPSTKAWVLFCTRGRSHLRPTIPVPCCRSMISMVAVDGGLLVAAFRAATEFDFAMFVSQSGVAFCPQPGGGEGHRRRRRLRREPMGGCRFLPGAAPPGIGIRDCNRGEHAGRQPQRNRLDSDDDCRAQGEFASCNGPSGPSISG